MRILRLALASIALPVAILAIVVVRAVPLRRFWDAYWRAARGEEASDGVEQEAPSPPVPEPPQ